MRRGDTWIGIDGTAYVVVSVKEVAEEEPRWWIDYREVQMRAVHYSGPESPQELHHLPPSEDCALALVRP